MDPGELNLAEALVVLKPLAFFVFGMAIYAIFIFNFYRFVGRRDLVELKLERYEQSKMRALRMTFHFFSYVGKYLILFPLVAFAWFVILTTLLSFLAKQQSIDGILMVAMAVLSAIRITSYYNEDLSRDLSKILPFALLGVFLIDLSYFSLASSLNALSQAFLSWEIIVYYVGFVIALEFVMRITTPILKPLFSFGRSQQKLSATGTGDSLA